MKIRNLKIGTRLAAGFGIIIVLMLAVTVVGTIYLMEADKHSNHVKDMSLPYALLADDMVLNIVQVQQWLTDVSATHDQEGFNKAKEAADNVRQDIKQFQSKFTAKGDTQNLAKLKTLKDKFEDYNTMGISMAYAYIFESIEAGNLMMTEFDKVSENLSALAAQFRDEQKDEAIMMTNMIKAAIMMVLKITMGLCAIALLTAIVTATFITRSITDPIKRCIEISKDMAAGNVSQLINMNTKDEVGKLAASLDTMAISIKDSATKIITSTDIMASSSEELSATTTQLAEGAKIQAMQTDQSATAMDEMSQSVLDVAQNASAVADDSMQTSTIAAEGRQKVEQTVQGMHDIAETVNASVATIEELGRSSEQIGEIISTINDIADQTNLLALNAAIEAARAGEQGRGFAVVADEVRKLAERTARATMEISEMITRIQGETSQSVLSMQNGRDKVRSGVEVAEAAMASLDSIVTASEHSADMIRQIATATEQQSSAVEEVSSTINSIATVTSDNKSASDQIQDSSNQLSKLAVELNEMANWYKI